MKYINIKLLFSCCLLAILSLGSIPDAAAQVIYLEDFEAVAPNVTLTGACTAETGDYFGFVDNASIDVNYPGNAGTFLGAQDTDGISTADCPTGGGASVSATFPAVDASACAGDLYICVDIADAAAGDGADDWEDNSEVRILIDGTSEIMFSGTGVNTPAYAGGDASSSCSLSGTMDTYCAIISPADASNIVISIEMDNLTQGDVDVGIDNVQIICDMANLPAGNQDFDACAPVTCSITDPIGPATFACGALTAGADPVTISVPYLGMDAGAVIVATVNGGTAITNTGDDPATVMDGTMTFAVTEGDTYSIGFAAPCDGITALTGTVPACDPNPELTVTKTAGNGVDDIQYVTSGDDAVFSITLENTGTTNLCLVSISDPMAPGTTACEPVFDATLIGDGDADFEPGESFTYTCSIAGVTADLTNMVTVSYEDCGNPGVPLSASDMTEVAVLCAIENVSVTQVCTGTNDDYTVDICFENYATGPSGMFNVYLDPPATNEPMTVIGTYPYASLVAGCFSIPAADLTGDASDTEAGLQFCVGDMDAPAPGTGSPPGTAPEAGSSGLPNGACPTILGIFVNACGSNEGQNEFVVFQNGDTPIVGDDITVDPPNSDNYDAVVGWQSAAMAEANIATAGWICSCCVGADGTTTIPANAPVVITGNNLDQPYDLTGLCAAGSTVYVMSSASTATGGHFSNSAGRTTTLSVSNAGAGCTYPQSYSYLDADLTGAGGADGDYAIFTSPDDPTYPAGNNTDPLDGSGPVGTSSTVSNNGCTGPEVVPEPALQPECYGCTTLTEVACSNCNISAATATASACDNQMTLPNDLDDTFTFTLDVTQDDPTFTGYTFDGSAFGLSSTTAGTYGATFTSPNLLIGALAGTTLTLTIVDDMDPNCTFMVDLVIPATCSICPDLSVVANPVCSAVGTMFDISYTITGGTGPYTITESLGGTVSTGQLAAGTLAGLTYAGPTQNDKVTLTIEDEGNPGCTIMYDVLQLNCTEPTACACDPAEELTLNAQATGNGDGFSMVYVLDDPLGGIVVNQTGTFGAADGVLSDGTMYTTYAFNIADDELADFLAQLTTDAELTDAADGTYLNASNADTPFCYVVEQTTLGFDCVCNACPTSTAPAELATICTGEAPTLPDAVLQAAVTDPDGEAVGAPTPTIFWFEDMAFATPYAGGALNHSGLDNCATEPVVLYAAIQCMLDNSFISAGTLTTTIYPAPQAPIITKNDNVCNYTLSVACPALDNVVSNDFSLSSAPGDAAGTANVVIDNAGGCSANFAVNYAACNACPTSTQPAELATICTGDTPTLPDAVIQAAVTDPDGEAVGAPTPTVSWFVDAALTTAYAGGAIAHSGADNCASETVTLYAAVQCAIDNSVISAGTLAVTVYPAPQAPTITKSDNVCNYTLVLACPGLDNEVSNDFTLLASPGDAAGTANVVIDNAGGCSESFVVPYDACNACPSSTEPAELATICTGDTPTLPDAVIQAAVTDPGGEAVGAPTPTVSWFVDAALTTAYAGGAIAHSGADICASETVTLYAAVQCAIDNSFISAGTLVVTVYPAPQAPTITLDDNVCNYSLVLACPALDNVVSNDFTLATSPGDAGGAANVVIDNAGGCSDNFTVAYAGCSSACDDIIVDASTECAADGTYSIVINSIIGGDNVDNGWNIVIAGTTYAESDFPLTGQVYSGVDQAKVTLSVTEPLDPACTTTFDVFELNCADQEACNCANDPDSYSINAMFNGNANGYTNVYVLVDNDSGDALVGASNLSGSFTDLADNTNYTVYGFNVLDGEVMAFQTALDMLASITAGDDVLNVMGDFAGFCYTASAGASYTEDCNCFVCTPAVGVADTGEICLGETFTYDFFADVDQSFDAGTTFSWTSGAGNGTGNISLSPTLPGDYTISVIPTAPAPNDACPGDAFDIVLTVNDVPSGTPDTDIICLTETFDYALTSALAGTTFAWSGDNGASGTGDISDTPTAAGTVIYTVTPTGPAPSSCDGNTFDITLTVNSADVVAFSYDDVCVGTSSGLPVGDPGFATGGVYSLSPDPMDGTTIDAATGIVSGGVAGMVYTVSYTSPAAGCQATATATVGFFPCTSQLEVCNCAGGDGTLIAVSEPGTFNSGPDYAMEYILVDADGNIVAVNTDGTGTFPGVPTGVYEIYAFNYAIATAGSLPTYTPGSPISFLLTAPTVTQNGTTYSSDNPCYEVEGPAVGSVNQCIPDVDAVMNISLCGAGDMIDLDAMTPAENNGIAGTGTWYAGTSNTDPAVSGMVTAAPGDMFYYEYVGTDDGCIATASFSVDEIVVNPPNPLANITVCEGGDTELIPTGGGPVAEELFFSEYIESGNNKCLELYNGTGADIDLSTYAIETYNNGNAGPPNSTLALSGTIMDGETFVICGGSVIAAMANETDLFLNLSFNGNDAVVLTNGGAIVDIFANIGCDPGGIAEDMTLVRLPGISAGITMDPANVPCEFPTQATEWMQLPQDDASDLGSHTYVDYHFYTDAALTNEVSDSPAASYDPDPAGGTSVDIWVTVESNGCVSTPVMVNVTVNENPVLAAIPAQQLCAGSTVTLADLNPALDAGSAGGTYVWTDDANNTVTEATESGTYTVTYTDTNTPACSGSTTFDFTVNPQINIVPSAATTCNAEFTGFTTTFSVEGGLGTLTFDISDDGNGLDVNGAALAVTGSGPEYTVAGIPNNVNVTVTVTGDDFSCTSAAATLVTDDCTDPCAAYNPPTVTNVSLCESDVTASSLQIAPVGGGNALGVDTYNYYEDNGGVAGDFIISGTVYTPTVNPGETLTIWVTAASDAVNDCESNPVSVTLSVDALPSATVNTTAIALCNTAGGASPSSVDLDALVSDVANGTGSWTEVGSTTAITSFDGEAAGAGNYQFIYTVAAADGSGCPDFISAVLDVTVDDCVVVCPDVSLVSGISGDRCEDDLTVSASVDVTGGFLATTTVAWYMNGEMIPGATGNSYSGSVAAAPSCGSASYTLSAIATCDAGSSSEIAAGTITVYDIPEAGTDFTEPSLDCNTGLIGVCPEVEVFYTVNGQAIEGSPESMAVGDDDLLIGYTVSVPGAPAGCEATGSYTVTCPEDKVCASPVIGQGGGVIRICDQSTYQYVAGLNLLGGNATESTISWLINGNPVNASGGFFVFDFAGPTSSCDSRSYDVTALIDCSAQGVDPYEFHMATVYMYSSPGAGDYEEPMESCTATLQNVCDQAAVSYAVNGVEIAGIPTALENGDEISYTVFTGGAFECGVSGSYIYDCLIQECGSAAIVESIDDSSCGTGLTISSSYELTGAVNTNANATWFINGNATGVTGTAFTTDLPANQGCSALDYHLTVEVACTFGDQTEVLDAGTVTIYPQITAGVQYDEPLGCAASLSLNCEDFDVAYTVNGEAIEGSPADLATGDASIAVAYTVNTPGAPEECATSGMYTVECIDYTCDEATVTEMVMGDRCAVEDLTISAEVALSGGANTTSSVAWMLNGVLTDATGTSYQAPVAAPADCQSMTYSLTAQVTCDFDGSVTMLDAGSMTVYAVPSSDIDFSQPDGCGSVLLGVCSGAEVSYSVNGEAISGTPTDLEDGDQVSYVVSTIGAPVGCATAGTYTVSCPDECPTLEVEGGENSVITVCSGEEVDLTVAFSNIEPDQILWSDGTVGPVLSIGTVTNESCDAEVSTLIATANVPTGEGCGQALVEFTVTVLAEPNASATVDISNDGCSVTVEACDGYDVSYSVDGGAAVAGHSYTANPAPGTTENNEVSFTITSPTCGPSTTFVESLSCTAEPVCPDDFELVINEICNDETGEITLTVNIVNGTAPYDISGEFFSAQGYTDDTFQTTFQSDNPDAGASFEVVDANACVAAGGVVPLPDCITVPIELVLFTGEVQEEGNKLYWITATEMNVDYYNLYRSVDGINFEEIAAVDSRGNTNQTSTYEHLDKHAPMGTSYYKMESVDNDGTRDYSEVIALYRGDKGFQILALSPVPVVDIMQVSYSHVAAEKLVANVYDVNGRLVQSRIVESQAGLNSITVDMTGVAAGAYILEIAGESAQVSSKFVKQ